LKGEEANLGLIAAFGEIFGIPYASTLLSFYSVYKNYQAGTLQNKLVQYMHGINEMTFPKREKLRQKIESDRNFKRDVVSVLLEMIDNTCTDSNVDILINLTNSLAEDRISIDDFYRLSLVLRRCLYTDLECLSKYVLNDDRLGYLDEENSSSFSLLSAGLLYMPVFGTTYNFVVNDLGEKMIKYGLSGEDLSKSH